VLQDSDDTSFITLTRRCGELLKEAKENKTLEGQGGDHKSNSRQAILKLEDLGISYDQAHDWQKLSGIPKEQFERSRSASLHRVSQSATSQPHQGAAGDGIGDGVP
jgi:hypothetical protein